MASFLRAAILIAAAPMVGCTVHAVDDPADANGSMTEGVVVVERMVTADGPTSNISAKFMRLGTPVDVDLAERVVGSKLELPAIGACRPLTAASVASALDGKSRAGSIELLDVGDVTLKAGANEMPLSVRAFPDVGDLVSGMFYTSPDAASDLPAGDAYKLEGTGSSSVDRFIIDAEAPAALEDVKLGSASLADGVSLDEGMPVPITWAAGARRDLVVVDVSAASGASVRCAFPDDGKATLPGWILRTTTLGAMPATATVAVHRIRERSFSAPGLDAGSVRFDLAVSGRASVTPSTLGAVPRSGLSAARGLP